MCGICGIVYNDASREVQKETLLRMRDSLRHRGPDDEGIYLSEGIGLGHRRLSVIDLSELGRQPMSTPDGRYHLIYNGEIFNYKELRIELEVQGIRFRSHTDTEVLLWLYVKYGTAMLPKLNGMFAFAVWDQKNRELFIGRDRFGVKPLCYAITKDGFYFSSEEKALFEAGVPLEFDPNSWEELLYFRYVSGERTPFKEVQKLLPGHYLLWKEGKVEIQRWWDLLETSKRFEGWDPNYLRNQYLEILDDAIRLVNISDVPVGVLLSGGLDSGCIAASLARSIRSRVSGFTIRFSDPHYDEGPLAAQVAKKWHLIHHEVTVDSNTLLSTLQEASWFNDEPLTQGDDVFIYIIARYAKPYATVLLSGEGADETLGGYVRYRPLLHYSLMNFLRPWFPLIMAAIPGNTRYHKLAAFLKLGNNDKFIYFNTCNVLPEELSRLGMRSEMDFQHRDQVFKEAKVYSREAVRQRMYIDQHSFLNALLHRNDRMTMGSSIECRVPFLDHRLAEIAAALPTNYLFDLVQGKKILRDAMRLRLPSNTIKRQKWGFGVPWQQFLREGQLRDFLRELPDMEPLVSSPLDRKVLRQYLEAFQKGSDHHYLFLLQLLMITLWYQVRFVHKGIRKPVLTVP